VASVSLLASRDRGHAGGGDFPSRAPLLPHLTAFSSNQSFQPRRRLFARGDRWPSPCTPFVTSLRLLEAIATAAPRHLPREIRGGGKKGALHIRSAEVIRVLPSTREACAHLRHVTANTHTVRRRTTAWHASEAFTPNAQRLDCGGNQAVVAH